MYLHNRSLRSQDNKGEMLFIHLREGTCSFLRTIFAPSTMLNQFPLLVSVTMFDGEQLSLTRITRNEMGAYLCIATNGVPPTVSKRITLDVECEFVTSIPPARNIIIAFVCNEYEMYAFIANVVQSAIRGIQRDAIITIS